MSSSIENIEKVLGAKRFGDRSAQIDWILTDSRSSVSYTHLTLPTN